ncbi:MAG: chromosome segregation protein SMC, partial [Hyphomicrobiaceae bacterium]
MRDREAERAAALQRLKIENENLSRERERVEERSNELQARLAQLQADLSRETEAAGESKSEKERLENERAELEQDGTGEQEAEAKATKTREKAEQTLKAHEAELNDATRRQAELGAEHRRIENQSLDATNRKTRLVAEAEKIAIGLEESNSDTPELVRIDELTSDLKAQTQDLRDLEERTIGAEKFSAARATDERAAVLKENEDRIALKNTEAERDALKKLVGRKSKSTSAKSAVDQITMQKGYEKALAAALGEELDAPVEDPQADAYWRAELSTVPGPELPADATPLTHFVTGPKALQRRLAQIGVVDDDTGDSLQELLTTGQRLVSRSGGLWRWDGFVIRPGAETAAAKRLAMRNRIKELDKTLTKQKASLKASEKAATKARTAAETARTEEKKLRAAWREQQARVSEIRDELATLERTAQKSREKIAALTDARDRNRSEHADAIELVATIAAAQTKLDDPAKLNAAIEKLTATVNKARDTTVRLRTEASRIAAERNDRVEKISRIKDDIERWSRRTASADKHIEDLNTRLEETTGEIEKLASLPDEIARRHRTLQSEISKAETARKDAADRLATADTQCRTCDAKLKEAQGTVAGLRENRARSEARLEAARERMADHARTIRETLECAPEKCLEHAGVADAVKLPPLTELERKLQKLKADRERLGGVNLRAEEELEELTEQFESMERERVDLEEAIAKLRQGISKLNREARRRLLEAFEQVNGHFKRLFKTLFNGGEAELKLVDSDDPLEAGLEIIACPPGKKPNTLSLLSGGEQALTATSLTFAVFLTNPSPICVLDEVDAPLDDANVERFCDLLDEMARSTDTRFLVITHHPNTMARMRRL